MLTFIFMKTENWTKTKKKFAWQISALLLIIREARISVNFGRTMVALFAICARVGLDYDNRWLDEDDDIKEKVEMAVN